MAGRKPKRKRELMERLHDWYLDKPGWLPFPIAGATVLSVTVLAWLARTPVVEAALVGMSCGFLVFVAGMAALIQRFERRHLLAYGQRLSELRRLSWEELENVVAEVFRADGFAVVETGQAGPDGGVDLVLTRGSGRTFVQCKHHHGWLDVRPVRELYGVMCLEKATRGVIVSTGDFSSAAVDFARRAGIQTMTGTQLAQKVRDLVVAHRGETTWTLAFPPNDVVVLCPICRSDMRWSAGPQLGWRCSRAPSCDGTVRVRARERRDRDAVAATSAVHDATVRAQDLRDVQARRPHIPARLEAERTSPPKPPSVPQR